MERPAHRRFLVAGLLLLWATCTVGRVLAEPNTSSAPSAGPRAVTATFYLEPPAATVWRRTVEGHINYLGRSGEAVTLGLNQSESSGSRDLFLEFRVPLWFGDYVSPQEYVKAEQLLQAGRFPPAGRLELSLSGFQRFQMHTRRHPFLSLLVGCFLLVAPAALISRRRKPKTPVSPVPGYTLSEKIGEGGMGEVYAATSADGTRCAIKLLRSMLSQSSDFRHQFDQELNNYLALKHPNLLHLFGYGYATDGRPYLVTELLQGETLKERLQRAPGDSSLAAEVLEQIGSALDHLHQSKLVHRDVKPGNIFLCTGGTLKLLDLGVSQALEGVQGVAGTPAYMAPEQFQGNAVLESDQYALGLVLLEVFQGRDSSQSSQASVIANQRSLGPPKMDRVPERVRPYLRKMLDPEPGLRFPDLQTARSVLTDILLEIR